MKLRGFSTADRLGAKNTESGIRQALACVRNERFARLAEFDSALVTLKQPVSERVLQFLDVTGNRGLLHAELARRSREMQFFGRRHGAVKPDQFPDRRRICD